MKLLSNSKSKIQTQQKRKRNRQISNRKLILTKLGNKKSLQTWILNWKKKKVQRKLKRLRKKRKKMMLIRKRKRENSLRKKRRERKRKKRKLRGKMFRFCLRKIWSSLNSIKNMQLDKKLLKIRNLLQVLSLYHWRYHSKRCTISS